MWVIVCVKKKKNYYINESIEMKMKQVCIQQRLHQ